MRIINRRTFIKKTSALGVVSVVSSIIPNKVVGNLLNDKIDISVVNGTDYFNNTIKAIEMLGGIRKFIPKGSKVGLLINSPFERPGTFTKPDIALAVLKLCKDAGATTIYNLKNSPEDYWKRSSYYEKYSSLISEMKNSTSHSIKNISNGKLFNDFEIIRELDDCDILINIPIIKHHDEASITCCLKNLMGLNHGLVNRKFHEPVEGFNGTGNEYLSQCIADLNLVRKSDLCVVDATEILTTNGPFGPGEIISPQKIIAGTDAVAVDTYCTETIGFNQKDVKMLEYAKNHELGETNLGKLNIKET